MSMLLDRRRRGPIHDAWQDWTGFRDGRWRVTILDGRTRLVVWYALADADKARLMLMDALG